jgi:aspartate/methionine/tyrosine aminotransferase
MRRKPSTRIAIVRLAPFLLERWQSEWENRVPCNLAESGVHPLSLEELLPPAEREALARVRLGYTQTNGTPELRAAIAAGYPGATPDNVLVTTGTSEANYVGLWRLVEPGDEVVAVLPNYMQLPGVAEGFGARLVPVWLRAGPEWRLDPAELQAAMTPRTRVVLVCNPNNPTGAVLSAAEMDAVEAAAARHGSWIVADEVYRHAVFDPPAPPSFWGRGERVLVTSGLSKAFGLPGLRIGWVVGPAGLVAELWGRRDYTTISPAALSDAIATAVLEPARCERLLARTRALLRENHAVVADWLARRGGRFSSVPPRAGAIALVRCDSRVPSEEIAHRALERGVLIVPGAQFGMEGTLRLGFGNEAEVLRAGLDRLAPVFDTLET